MNAVRGGDRMVEVTNGVLLRPEWTDGVQTSTVGDGRFTAEFRVESPAELNRARLIAGEEDVLVSFLDDLAPWMDVWDVGAAVGTWTCFVGKVASEVRAFEPHLGNGDRLLENATLNGVAGDVTLERVGLAGRGKEDASLAVGGGIGTGTHRVDDRNGSRSVALKRGDSYPTGPDALKVDVEGFERQVLDGMGDHLDGVRVAAVEVHPQYDVPVDAVRARLADAGLTVSEVATDRRERYLLGRRSDDSDRSDDPTR